MNEFTRIPLDQYWVRSELDIGELAHTRTGAEFQCQRYITHRFRNFAMQLAS